MNIVTHPTSQRHGRQHSRWRPGSGGISSPAASAAAAASIAVLGTASAVALLIGLSAGCGPAASERSAVPQQAAAGESGETSVLTMRPVLIAHEKTLVEEPLSYADPKTGPSAFVMAGSQALATTGQIPNPDDADESTGGASGVRSGDGIAEAPIGDGRFRPDGLYREGDTVWVYSASQPEQRGYRLSGRDDSSDTAQTRQRWRLIDTRRGPLSTQRCVAMQRRPMTLCVGVHEPGGLVAFAHGTPGGQDARGDRPHLAQARARVRSKGSKAKRKAAWRRANRGKWRKGKTRGKRRGRADASAAMVHPAAFSSDLPRRGGFRDLAVDEARGLIYVLDAYDDALWVLDLEGQRKDRIPVTANSYQLGRMDDSALFILAGTKPYMGIISLASDGARAGLPTPQVPAKVDAAGTVRDAALSMAPAGDRGKDEPVKPVKHDKNDKNGKNDKNDKNDTAQAPPRYVIGVPLAVPVRTAAYDAARQVLWTAGYKQTRVRRNRGYIEHLRSYLYAFATPTLMRGQARPVAAVDLAAQRLTDPSALSIDAKRRELWIALTGNHKIAALDLDAALRRSSRAGARLRKVETALVPKTVLASDDGLFAAGFVDDRLYVHVHDHDAETTKLYQSVRLRPSPPEAADRSAAAYETSPSMYQLGEMLYYSKGLISESPRNQFTCNSCHWDGMTDYRVHPGFRESRFEQIRPAAGVGMLGPVFTPGQSRHIAIAVDGFIRYLDERSWHEPEDKVWLEPRVVRIAGGGAETLSAEDTRLALITYLSRLPVEPGFLRAPGTAFSPSAERGAEIFFRDCARCHQAKPHMRDEDVFEMAEALEYLRTKPLVFGDDDFAKTGVEPYFTEDGNRISPLTQLGRGGPFFSNSAATTLRDVIAQSNPERIGAEHAPDNAASAHYDDDDARALIDFLLSI